MDISIALCMWSRLAAAGGIAPSNQTLLEFMGAYGPSPIWAQIGDLAR